MIAHENIWKISLKKMVFLLSVVIFVSVFAPICCLKLEFSGTNMKYKVTGKMTCMVSSVDTPLLSLLTVSVSECVHQCVIRPKCEGLYYRRKFKLCDLVSENGDVETSGECLYIKRNDIVVEINICNNVCDGEQICDQDGNCIVKANSVCGYIEVPYGRTSGNMFADGDKLFVECDGGFTLHGSSTLKCMANGTWDSIPECKKECYVSDFNNADVTQFQNSSGSYAVNCNASYISNGTTDTANVVTEETVTCGNDGKWIPNIDCIDSKNLYNIALKKPTTQSSNYGSYGSYKGTDGIWDPDFSVGKSCTHTSDGGEAAAWWQVDLLQIYVIRRVKILNRTSDYFAARFRQVAVTIGISSNPTDVCGAMYVGPAKSEEMVEFICTVTGRYVRLSKPNFSGSQNLVVCEVGVYEN